MIFLRWLYTSLLIFFAVGCTIDEPHIPAWQTKAKIHISPDKVGLDDLFENEFIENRYSAAAGDSLFYLYLKDSTSRKTVSKEDLIMEGRSEMMTQELGVIDLDAPTPQQTPSVTLKEIFPALPAAGTLIPPIPDAIVSPDPSTIRFDSFQSVSIAEGDMRLVFHNNLILTVKEGMEISVYDSVSNSRLGTFLFADSIPNGTTAQSQALSLKDKAFSSTLRIEYSIPLRGTKQSRTLSDNDLNSHFYFDAILSPLKVNSAIAEIPAQTVTMEDSSVVEDEDITVQIAKIGKGRITLTLTNQFELSATATVKILSLVDNSGQPVQVHFNLPALSSVEKVIDLAGLSLQHHENAGQAITHLFYELEVQTQASSGYATLSSTDKVEVNFVQSDIELQSLQGIIKRFDITIDPVEEDDLFDFEVETGKMQLPDLQFKFTFFNQINFDVDMDLRLAGYKKDASGHISDSVIVSISETIKRGNQASPEKTILILDKNSTTPSIVDLMAILPDNIVITGDAKIEGQGSVALNDAVWAEYEIESPLAIEIKDAIEYQTELDSVNLNKANTEDLVSAGFFINGTNGLPLGADVKVMFASNADSIFIYSGKDSLRYAEFQTQLTEAETDGQGLVTKPSKLSSQFFFNTATINLLKQEKLYYITKIFIPPTSKKVTVRKSDAFNYGGYIQVETRVNDEE